jgi:hypothetical protein
VEAVLERDLGDDLWSPVQGLQLLERGKRPRSASPAYRQPTPQGPNTSFSRSMTPNRSGSQPRLIEDSSNPRLVSALSASGGNGALRAWT